MKRTLFILVFFSSLVVCTYGANDKDSIQSKSLRILIAAEQGNPEPQCSLGVMYANGERDTTLRFATFVAEQGVKMSRRRHNAVFLDGFVRGLISITIHATGAGLFDQIVFVNPFCERKIK